MPASAPVRRRAGRPQLRPDLLRRRLASLTLVAVLATGALAACGSDPDTDQADAEAAAAALAAGLGSGDLSGVTFAGATVDYVTTTREQILLPLGDAVPTVSATGVTLADDKSGATATLSYEWNVGGTPWTYTTTAALTHAEDEPWKVTWAPDVLIPEMTEDEQLLVDRVPSVRADILGDGDAPLVTQRPVKIVGIDKTSIPAADQDAAARALATLTGIDPDTYAAKVAGAGAKAYVEAVTLRTEADYDWAAIAASPGVLLQDKTLPLAPTREFASAILGRSGPATAEIVEESGGAISANDVTGLSGLQRQFNSQLAGTPGVVVQAVGLSGVGRDLMRVDAVDGSPLHTTLNPTMQVAAETILAEQTVPAAIVAVRPSTGAVLVSASAASNGLSTATTGMYAPGSTFKIVSALAMLRSGMTPDTVLPCSEQITVDGRVFKNFPDYPSSKTGDISLRTVIANSCNTAMISAADAVSQADLVSAGQSLGLGLAPAPGVPVFTGNVPADSTGTDHAASLIGQGQVQASPLAMAAVAASVAAGTTVRPTFLNQEATGAASDLPADPSTPLTPEESAQLADLMRAVVTEGGGSFLADVPGAPVGAKTGTAQYGDGSTNHVWVMATQGDLAVVAFVETGDYGSTTAGPLLEAFLRAVA